ncbi:peptidoglycan D,D-transpeptidase FtsI family protein [Cellulomonas marina]|uniref:Cell division protein FtsI (Penicillin-binding protein 3) n=1 Tax=Cellulomonas marina TaxID=988821 RepID=A0A1I0VKK7_9CELL|nr:penicillin-binding protein 2 [Cellulomonas marina]GIG27908.1 cell division protein FtsI [Cellulomonas marina]SFA76862.1 cell division protein FtsI (penicillin-binding protein 3) [Cellulomonas marina]
MTTTTPRPARRAPGATATPGGAARATTTSATTTSATATRGATTSTAVRPGVVGTNRRPASGAGNARPARAGAGGGGGGAGGRGGRRPGALGPVAADARGRTAFLTVLVLALLAVFAGRLVWVQVVVGPARAEEALASRLTTRTEVLGTRGQITDADGVALATSVERYVVWVNQHQVAEFRGSDEAPEGAAGVAQLLAPLLDADVAELGGRLVGEAGYKVLQKDVLPEIAREIRSLGLPGIGVDMVPDRVYPNGTLAGNVVGFVNSSDQGVAGLEAALDGTLTGEAGWEQYERGRMGQAIPGGYSEGDPARDGLSVRTTIVSDIQWKAQAALDAQVAATGSDSGTVVVMDPRTGAVLALADSGSIDPNSPGGSTGSLTPSVSDVFEPGSTGKVVTMAAALEQGITTPTDQYEVPYTYTTENGQTFKDSHEHELQRLTTTGVLAESSNTGTVMIGQRLSEPTREEYLRRFGFGARTGIELPGESAGRLLPAEEWDGRSQYAVLFGQALSVTAVQATSVFATIANGGVRVAPHLVAGTTDEDGTFTPAAPAASTQVVSAETAGTVLSMLESVVDDGTGGSAAIEGYRVAGKTGTAQNWVDGVQGITASFIGVAPVDDPRLVVSVILHNPRTSEWGGTVAAPVFQDVTRYALGELGVAPSGTAPTLYPTTW